MLVPAAGQGCATPGRDTEQTAAGGLGEPSLRQGSGRQTDTAHHTSENNYTVDIPVIAKQQTQASGLFCSTVLKTVEVGQAI